jgi:hypothetical protein
MTIEEFAQRLGRDEQPTKLMDALRTLQAGDLRTLKESHSLGLAWGDWSADGGGGSPQPPRLYVERPELWS